MESPIDSEVRSQKEHVMHMRMPSEDAEISGLFIWPEYFSESVEDAMVNHVAGLDNWAGISDDPKSRRVIHYGYKYDYRKMNFPVKILPIPEIFTGPARLVASAFLGESRTFDQLIINEYMPGQGISPHVDHPQQFGDVIFCICIGSDITITFTHPDGRVAPRRLVAGSAYAMTGKARHVWRHGIEAKKSDYVGGKRIPRGIRYSLTYRTIRFPS